MSESLSSPPPPAAISQRLRVEIHGAVQGVGFRPFVYRLATDLSLRGWVINDSQGVFVEVEGAPPALDRFLERLPAEKPPRAIIHSLEASRLEPAGYQTFEIRHSDGRGSKTVLVLPDIATCADCLAEVLDPGDRRHHYPFTNCTNCGPRFTIVQSLPYDRPGTTMRRFVMCPECQAEYENPLNRRFHAQPNACPVCGPKLALYGPRAEDGATDWGTDYGADRGEPGRDRPNAGIPAPGGEFAWLAGRDDALIGAAQALQAGQIVAVKGLGGFHLMVDAASVTGIARLRERKPRRDKPFAVMVGDLEQARRLCLVSDQAAELLASPEAPIVLLPRRQDAPVAATVAPGNPTLGIMLPYTPLHHLLLREVGRPLVATSGNLTDEPICTDEHEAMARLGHIADRFLVHDRPIARHADDSVAWIADGEVRLLRRARGYAPLPVMLPEPVPTVLAVGAHLKNTVALGVERQVFISQHIGDLETAEALAAFEQVIADFLRLYEARPVAVAHDLHPHYLSTQWAKENAEAGMMNDESQVDDSPFPIHHSSFPIHHSSFPIHHSQLIPVQHHHAHLAACLAENGMAGPALGVTWDGTGYGTDGTVWGGEFLLGDAAGYQRVAHLRAFRLPGGDAAIKEPRRIAFAMLWELYGDGVVEMDHLAPVRALSLPERRVLAQMLRRGLNAPLTTSAGRLFDGVASLLGLQQQVSFEGQAAMALEFTADPRETGHYEFVVEPRRSSGSTKSNSGELPQSPPSSSELPRTPTSSAKLRQALPHSPLVLDWAPLVEAVLADLQQGITSGIMASRFHNALVEAIVTVARQVGQPQVALTGGCFQNRLLCQGSAGRLRQEGFQVLMHRLVPPNDGGISLGQIAVATAQLAAG